MTTKKKIEKKPTPLSWTAIRRGKFYCAPACGRGCTLAEFNRATKNGEALARKMGKGWKAHIHENVGWHYCAASPGGFVTVYEHRHFDGVSYSAMANTNGSIGSGQWVCNSAETARAAAENVIAQMRREFGALREVLIRVEGGRL